MSQYNIAICQYHIKNLMWDIIPSNIRGIHGEKLDTIELELNSIFHGDTSMIIVFDYNDILKGKEWNTRCYNSIDSIVLNTRISQVILENEFGEMIPLSDNLNFPTYKGYMRRNVAQDKSAYNFDLFPINGNYARTFKHLISIPKYALKICRDNQKIRLHYLYRAKKKYKHWSNKDYIISSNWFLISDVH